MVMVSTMLEGGCSTDSNLSLNSSSPLVRESEVKVFKRRWYILFIFSLVAVLQGEYNECQGMNVKV